MTTLKKFLFLISIIVLFPVLGVAAASASTVTRSFSTVTPTAGSPITVSLGVSVVAPNLTPPNDFYIIDEVVPAGWTVTASTNGGDFVSQAGHVKWVVTGGALSITDTYTVTVPAAATGLNTFSGQFGFGTTTPTSILGPTDVTVSPVAVVPVLTSISVTPTTTALAITGTSQLSASALDQNSVALAPQPTMTWTSSNPAAATVDTTGLVTAVAPGTTNVTAASGAVTSNSSVITVTAPAPAPTPTSSAVTRGFSTVAPTVGSSLTVTLAVNVLPPNTTVPNDFYIIDEVVPTGWTVTSSTNGGDFVSQAGHVKWIVTGGAVSLTDSYTITVPATATGTNAFSGQFGFGSAVPTAILGPTSVTISVVAPDTIPPVITILGANPATVTVNTSYSDAGATALDNVDGDVTAKIVSTSTVNITQVGTYSVTYSVSDLAGNTASSTRTVNVVAAPPVVVGGEGGGGVVVGGGGGGSTTLPPSHFEDNNRHNAEVETHNNTVEDNHNGGGNIGQVLGEKVFDDGTIIRGNDKKTFIIINGLRRQLNSTEIKKFGRNKKILTASSDDLSKLPLTNLKLADDKSFANGLVLRSQQEHTIFVIEKGQKKSVESMTELRKLLKKNKMQTIDESILSHIPDFQQP